jgi:hypothetical protein
MERGGQRGVAGDGETRGETSSNAAKRPVSITRRHRRASPGVPRSSRIPGRGPPRANRSREIPREARESREKRSPLERLVEALGRAATESAARWWVGTRRSPSCSP